MQRISNSPNKLKKQEQIWQTAIYFIYYCKVTAIEIAFY